MKNITIDFDDFNQLIELMDRSDEFDTMLIGHDDNGKYTQTSILPDMIINDTELNSPKWFRRMIYHRDGTVEELYETDESL